MRIHQESCDIFCAIFRVFFKHAEVQLVKKQGADSKKNNKKNEKKLGPNPCCWKRIRWRAQGPLDRSRNQNLDPTDEKERKEPRINRFGSAAYI